MQLSHQVMKRFQKSVKMWKTFIGEMRKRKIFISHWSACVTLIFSFIIKYKS